MKRIILVLFLSIGAFASFGQGSAWPASGTNTYTATITNFGTSGYEPGGTGKTADVFFANTNSTASTINISSQGAAPLRKWDGAAWVVLTGAEILTNFGYHLVYNVSGNYFEMHSGIGSGSGGGIETVTGDGVDNTDPLNPVLSFPTKSEIGLGSVENTALSTWPGTANVTTLGTIGIGTWNGSVVGSLYGGTGINNGGRTLTISTNSGTIAYTNSSTSLTVANTASVSGTNTGDQTSVIGNAGTATALQTARMIGTLTGDATSAGSSFNGTANNTNAITLATVNSNIGTFGSATQVVQQTINAKGLITAASNVTITPAIGSITGLGTGVATAAADNINTSGGLIANPMTATGDLIYGASSGGAARLPGAAGVLHSAGASTPTWSAVSLTADVSGTLPVANGGTGITSFGTGIATALGVNIGSAGAPVLFNGAGGTPASMTGTNIIGTAAGLTAGNVTTNANLTGPITSSGNATSVAAQTGTGSTFVMNTSPTLVTPNLGIPSAAVLTNATGLPGTSVINIPAGNIVATTGQAAINELDTEKLNSASNLSDVSSPALALQNLDGDQATTTFNTQTGDYTLVLGDFTTNTTILMNNGSAAIVTFPPHSSVAIPVGKKVCIRRTNVSGGVTIAQGAGVTINPSAAGYTIAGNIVCACATQRSTDVWDLDNGSVVNVTNAQMANMANSTVKGRFTAGTGAPEDLTEAQLRRLVFDTPKYYRLYSDFSGGSSEFSSTVSGTGASISYTTDGGDANHPGVVTLSTGTLGTNSATLRNGSASTITPTDGALLIDAIVKVSAVSDGTETFTVQVGFSTSLSATNPSEFAGFRYTHSVNSGRWQTVTRHTSAETANDAGGSTVAGATYYRLTVISNSANTSYEFYLNGTLVQTHTTNLPGSTQGSIQSSIIKSAGLTARTLGTDYFQVIQEFNSSR